MREPRKPRKPGRIVSAEQAKRSYGGELPPKKISKKIPDSVATAPMPAPSNEDFFIEDLPVDPEPTKAEPPQLPKATIAGAALAKIRKVRSESPQPDQVANKAELQTPKWHQRVARVAKERFGKSKEQLSAAARKAVRVDGPIELSARRAEKKREERRFRLKTIGIISGVVGALALLIWVLFFSPLLSYSFQTEQIKLADNSIVNRGAVEKVVAAHSGEPVLRISRGKLAAEITSKVPEVKSAQVKLALPTGLEIAITPHEPVACLLANNACTALAEDGTKLNIAPEIAKTLPMVVAGDGAKLPDVVPTALEVLGELDADTRTHVVRAEITDANLVTLDLDGGRKAYWGEATQNAKKAKILAALLTQSASFYDVSSPSTPVTR